LRTGVRWIGPVAIRQGFIEGRLINYDTGYLSSIEQAMYFLITRMREKGVARDWKDIRQTSGIRADINIRNQMCEQLNRTSEVAEVRPQGMPLDAVPIPPLLDARLSGMATNAFTLSGLEEIDGCLYAQSWWCRDVEV
jgi:hypothetical protein